MRKNIVIGLTTAFLMVAGFGSSQADVLLVDDIGYGPCSVIRDLDNGRDYLALNFTAPYSYNEVLTQLGPGDLFEGWRVATKREVDRMGRSSDIENNAWAIGVDPAMGERAQKLEDWFAPDPSLLHGLYAMGLIKETWSPDTWDGVEAKFAYFIGRELDFIANRQHIVFFGNGQYILPDDPTKQTILTRDTNFDGFSAPYSIAEYHVNGLTYSDPSVCSSICIASASTEKRCNDGSDDDCDGFVDNVDSDCGGTSDPGSDIGGSEGKGRTCADGFDNDGNGYIDCDDPGCFSNKSCSTATEPGPDSGPTEGKGKTCSDGLDNDGNGYTDCDDESCSASKACK